MFSKKEWSETIKPFDNQILKEALQTLREKKDFPPTLPQFFDCCKDIQNRRVPAAEKPEPYKPSSPDVAKKYIDAMLKKLKG